MTAIPVLAWLAATLSAFKLSALLVPWVLIAFPQQMQRMQQHILAIVLINSLVRQQCALNSQAQFVVLTSSAAPAYAATGSVLQTRTTNSVQLTLTVNRQTTSVKVGFAWLRLGKTVIRGPVLLTPAFQEPVVMQTESVSGQISTRLWVPVQSLASSSQLSLFH